MERTARCRLLVLILQCSLPVLARANAPSFLTSDSRLPNLDRPFDMQDGPVEFPQELALYDLELQVLDGNHLNSFSRTSDGNWEFDSTYDLAYEAQVSYGLGPVHRVIGRGSAHIRGVAPGRLPLLFDTEVVALDLDGLSIRESPQLRSSGTTIVASGCLQCGSIQPIYRISSFVDIFAESSADGGATWAPANEAIPLVQQFEPVVPGDYDQSGTVDASDYVLWRKKIGTGALRNEGGVSNDLVDESDHVFWSSRFGARAESQFFFVLKGPVAASVPEPSAFLLLTIGALAALGRRGLRQPGAQ